MVEELITVVGSTYYQPVLDLIEGMLRCPPQKVAARRINVRENGYALSIVLLLVVMLESYVGRIRYLQASNEVSILRSVPKYIKSLNESFQFQGWLDEVFVLRDVIAHGHVWVLTLSVDENYEQILHKAILGTTYGDKRYHEVVDENTGCTRILGLNIVPTAVGREEVLSVLDVTWKTLNFLADNRFIEHNILRFRGRY